MKRILLVITILLVLNGCDNSDEKTDYDIVIEDVLNRSNYDDFDELNFEIIYSKKEETFYAIIENDTATLNDFKAIVVPLDENGNKIGTAPQIGFFDNDFDFNIEDKGIILSGESEDDVDSVLIYIEYTDNNKTVKKVVKLDDVLLLE